VTPRSGKPVVLALRPTSGRAAQQQTALSDVGYADHTKLGAAERNKWRVLSDLMPFIFLGLIERVSVRLASDLTWYRWFTSIKAWFLVDGYHASFLGLGLVPWFQACLVLLVYQGILVKSWYPFCGARGTRVTTWFQGREEALEPRCYHALRRVAPSSS
jgi:hypothetical protein